jgi:nucleotidyltransferase/DNA polymerase involved in DNA repair
VASDPELDQLSIAHLDCDAFYASVEKRDRPELRDKPVIVGGGVRGVVTTACYVARLHGVGSAMPMYRALKACPDAVVIKPDFAKYTEVSRRIFAMVRALTPLVQTLSLDEAWIDLSGTEQLNGGPPALQLIRLQQRTGKSGNVTIGHPAASGETDDLADGDMPLDDLGVREPFAEVGQQEKLRGAHAGGVLGQETASVRFAAATIFSTDGRYFISRRNSGIGTS